MHDEAVQELPGAAFKRGISVLAKSRYAKHCLILGFDCEYDSKTQEIICYQLSDGEQHALYETDTNFTWPALAEWVRKCIVAWGYKLRDAVTIVLVSHFSTAELSHISDFWRNSTVRRVSPQQVYNATYRINKHSLLAVIDMYHFFNASLAKVCETFGEEKQSYDTRNVTRDTLKDPVFRDYATWDAAVCARVFTKFRARVWNDHQVDVIKYPTPASIAMAIYRRHFLPSTSPAPIGKIRKQAWRSLWGGRAEAYVAGDFYDDYTLRDVKSLYPTSVQHLDTLPHAHHWSERDYPQSWKGLCRVGFKFPDDCVYPCLPVYHDGRLLFPLRGVSDCTLAEVKTAVKFGAQIKWGNIFEYDTGDDSLHRYMNHFIAEKDRAEQAGDKVGRWLSKLFMNSLIGKLSQHKGDVDIEDLKAFATQASVPIEVALNPHFYHPDKPRARPRIGGNIMPEWSALILGSSRAVMAQLLAPVTSLICSTDSLLIPAHENAIVDNAMLDTSTILTNKNTNYGQCAHCPQDMPTAHVRVVRNRAYAGVCPHDQITFSATHAIHLPKRDDIASRFLLSDEPKYSKKRRLGLKQAIRMGRPFFDESTVNMTFRRGWDNKRRLLPDGTSQPWRSTWEYDRFTDQ